MARRSRVSPGWTYYPPRDRIPETYHITTDGTTVSVRNNSGQFVGSPSADLGAQVTTALPAASSAGALIVLGDGNFSLSTTPLLPKGITGKLAIRGSGGTILTLSTAAPLAFQFNRTADYDSFQNIEISDLLIDRGNIAVSGSTRRCVVLGYASSTALQRLNYSNIALRRIKTINVPTWNTDNTTSLLNVGIISYHPAAGETQTTVTDIVIEDCDFQGGNTGVQIGGVGGGATAEVYCDRIFLRNVKHDTLITPDGTNTTSNNFQLGGIGYGNMVRLENCYGNRCLDAGIEIDGIQDFVGRGCMVADSWNAKFFTRNFRAPLNAASQKNTWRDCYGYNAVIARSTRASSDFSIGGDQATASYDFGELAILDCHTLDTITAKPSLSGLNIDARSFSPKFRRLTVRNLGIAYTAISDNTSPQNSPIFIDLRSFDTSAVYDIDGLDWKLVGSMTGTGGNQMKMMRICGAGARTSIRRVTIDTGALSVAGSTTATFYWLAYALDFASTLAIYVDGVSFPAPVGSNAGTHRVIYLRTANLTITGQATVRGMDTANLPASGADFDVTDAAHKTATVFERIITQRAGTLGLKTAPTAMTGLVTATGLAIGSVIPGLPCFVQFVQGSGAGITAIDISTDGGTTYTNLLTQGAGAMPAGADLWVGPFRPDALVKVTFATTQPTTNIIPARL